jgi:peroxiredoxin
VKKNLMSVSVLTGVAVMAMGLGHFCLAGEEKTEEARVGEPAPDFTLKDTEGKEYKLSDLRGKVVVLEWINHECPVVNRVHKNKAIENTRAQFKDQPVVWLAIDSSHFANDKLSSIKKWKEEQKLDYPILLDAPGAVGRMYAAKTTPHMFVIDQKGNLAYTGALDKEADDEGEARQYVVEAVNALLKGSTVAISRTRPYGCSVKYKG